ncbi:MAG: hypothetical protein IPJ41_13970 [Phycisphaerales bacterium]|nr:hypothetical protein [Phycisphaerales bacterium]
MSRNRTTVFAVALLTTTTLSIAWAMQPSQEAPRLTQPAAKGQPVMPADCASMGKVRVEMMAQQEEADARLDGLLATMNSAAGPMKAEAMAAVVTELVNQRTDAHARMADMQPKIMQHMMQHVMEAAPADMQVKMQAQMDECPLMLQVVSPDKEHAPMTRGKH